MSMQNIFFLFFFVKEKSPYAHTAAEIVQRLGTWTKSMDLTRKLPTDPVYLDIDQSLVREETIHTVIKDAILAVFAPKKVELHEKWAAPQCRVGAKMLLRLSVWRKYTTRHWQTHPNNFFKWWFTDISTLGVKYARKKKIMKEKGVSCISIPDYGGPGLEAQTTLGNFYSKTS